MSVFKAKAEKFSSADRVCRLMKPMESPKVAIFTLSDYRENFWRFDILT